MLKELKTRLEGKTILRIDPPNAGEAICKFVLTDGSAFRLHATDLGYWVEEAEGPNGYNSLNGLIIDYGHHMYNLLPKYDFDPPHAKITISSDDVIDFIAPDGKQFVICVKNLSDKEIAIISHPKGKKLLAEAAALGNYWRTAFRPHHNDECPEELRMV